MGDDIRKLLEQLVQRVSRVEEEMAQHNQQAVQVTERLTRLTQDTEEIVALWSESKAAFKFFNRLMRAAAWTLKFILIPLFVVLALYHMATHNGEIPAWSKIFGFLK